MQAKIARRTFLMVVAMWLGARPGRADDDMTGIWSAQARTKGGLGSQWVFGRDGTVTYTFGALVDAAYEIDGNRLTMKFSGPDGARSQDMVEEFSIQGDTLTKTGPQTPGGTQVMQRVGVAHADAHPLVGDWAFTHPTTGKPACMRYSRGGTVQLCAPFQTRTGTFRVDGEALVIEAEGVRPLSARVDPVRRVLVVAEDDGRVSKTYLRFQH
jgi:hypothetical protein